MQIRLGQNAEKCAALKCVSHFSVAFFTSQPLKEDEVMPAKFEDDLIWVAADTPLSDSAFLSNRIKDLCGDLPIFWLRPTYSTSKRADTSAQGRE